MLSGKKMIGAAKKMALPQRSANLMHRPAIRAVHNVGSRSAMAHGAVPSRITSKLHTTAHAMPATARCVFNAPVRRSFFGAKAAGVRNPSLHNNNNNNNNSHHQLKTGVFSSAFKTSHKLIKSVITTQFAAMRSFSTQRYFTHEHEWIDFTKSSGIAVIGMTNYAQSSLGDIVYIDYPQVGAKIKRGDTVASIESVKAASDVYSPISGVLQEVNEKAKQDPSLCNSSPQDEGWLAKVKVDDENQFTDLMDEQSYAAVVAKLEEDH